MKISQNIAICWAHHTMFKLTFCTKPHKKSSLLKYFSPQAISIKAEAKWWVICRPFHSSKWYLWSIKMRTNFPIRPPQLVLVSCPKNCKQSTRTNFMAVKENRPQHGPLDLDLDYIYVMMAWHASGMTMETNSYTQISFVYAKSNRDPFHLYFQVCLLEIMEWEECPCLCDVPKWIRAFSYTSKVLTTIGKLLPLASPPYPRVDRTQ